MRKLFYIRVNSYDQSTERQLISAKELGIPEEYIFVEKVSGKDLKRLEYQLIRRMSRKGDLLYLQSLGRLGRNKQVILEEWRELTKEKQIDTSVLDMPLSDTANYKQLDRLETLIFDLIPQLFSYVVEDEWKRVNSRQREGVEAAKQKGVKFGRKRIALPPEFPAVYSDWKAGKIAVVYAMDQSGMKRNTFCRWVKEYEHTLYHFS